MVKFNLCDVNLEISKKFGSLEVLSFVRLKFANQLCKQLFLRRKIYILLSLARDSIVGKWKTYRKAERMVENLGYRYMCT